MTAKELEILRWIDYQENGVTMDFIMKRYGLSVDSARRLLSQEFEGLVFVDKGRWFTSISGSAILQGEAQVIGSTAGEIHLKETPIKNTAEKTLKSDDSIPYWLRTSKKKDKVKKSKKEKGSNPKPASRRQYITTTDLPKTKKEKKQIDRRLTKIEYDVLKWINASEMGETISSICEKFNLQYQEVYNLLNRSLSGLVYLDAFRWFATVSAVELISCENENSIPESSEVGTFNNEAKDEVHHCLIHPVPLSSQRKKVYIAPSLEFDYTTELPADILNSYGFEWVEKRLKRKRQLDSIVDGFNEMHKWHPQTAFSSNKGEMDLHELLIWKRYIYLHKIDDSSIKEPSNGSWVSTDRKEGVAPLNVLPKPEPISCFDTTDIQEEVQPLNALFEPLSCFDTTDIQEEVQPLNVLPEPLSCFDANEIHEETPPLNTNILGDLQTADEITDERTEPKQSVIHKDRELFEEWVESSFAYKYLVKCFRNREMSNPQILIEFNKKHWLAPKSFCSWKGNAMSYPELMKCYLWYNKRHKTPSCSTSQSYFSKQYEDIHSAYLEEIADHYFSNVYSYDRTTRTLTVETRNYGRMTYSIEPYQYRRNKLIMIPKPLSDARKKELKKQLRNKKKVKKS